MPKVIVFPRVDPYYLFDRDAVAFPALVDGEPIRCVVTCEALTELSKTVSFTEELALVAFREHREEIQSQARRLIEAGFVDDARGEVLIRSKGSQAAPDNLSITIPEGISNNLELARLVGDANGVLGELVKSSRITLKAQWEETDMLQLTLTDLETKASARDWYTPDRLRSRDLVKQSLDRLWGDVLRSKSRKHLEKISSVGGDS
jgi:hypothetical protein